MHQNRPQIQASARTPGISAAVGTHLRPHRRRSAPKSHAHPAPPHTPNTQKPPAAHGAQCTARERAETPASTANRVF
ncbi:MULTISPECIES: hypothetical protein [Corynebacterium]|uniref:hypothetical protein n=1 Tax=Corynebacterium TaxID=1716 RepID=UPI000F875AA8|nr:MULTISPECIES: hypothetical protein [Corynebacterium]MDK8684543.1 hypothetical protein [Corynebacterium pseudodiphtheriticum]MDK8806381.1 hypothetical protein [Corynebacterium pseudodiphtheriticum]